LQSNGFALGDVARTWFYIDKILSWYDDFNKARTAIYKNHTFRVGSLPASTGVAGENPLNPALALAAWAVQSRGKSNHPAREIISPMQSPASDYGSSFSRAVEIQLPVGRRLLISGTASINADGKTAWVGDVKRQIDLSMEVVDRILKSRGMSFADAARATAYFKRPEDSAALADWCARHDCQLPALLVHCDICRNDLLFEIELDAIIPQA